jgi:DUF1680 family protein
MHTKSFFLLLSLISGLFSCTMENKPVRDYPIRPVDFTRVRVQPGFWQSRIDTAIRVTIPYAFDKCEETGRVENFIFAGGIKEGKFRGRFGFDDSDVYKIMEGAAYSLMIHPDPHLEAYLDTLIRYISEAQEEDGYLYTAWTLKANDYNDFACCTYSDQGRFAGTFGGSHEFYNAGHMYEAAAAHYVATGKPDFLDVAVKNADLIHEVCITQGNKYVPGHQEIEIGLVKLFRATGNEKYLRLAKHLLDIRSEAGGAEYNQSHLPVTRQSEAVGHAVRANYMYTAMADIAALTGDTAYLEAIDRIWENVVSKKLSITGGVGASPHGEAYGGDYDLPNQPYNETCAAIANVYWNHRMFLLHGDAGYIDVLERTLYNGVLSGISLDGNLFFYPNTLQHDGKKLFNQGSAGRSPWFDCSCCPSNLARFLPSVGAYAYAVRDQDIYINLFINSQAELETQEGTFTLGQSSDYPWEGKLRIEVFNEKRIRASLNIRIPGWSSGTPVPSDLFRYTGQAAAKPLITVNGSPIEYNMRKGYAVVDGKWKKGDILEVHFPMEARLVAAHDSVRAKWGLLAFEYGPIIYCAEGIDNPGMELTDLLVSTDHAVGVSFLPDLLGGINVLQAKATQIMDGAAMEADIRLIPYYAWNHRGNGPMNVWFRH